MSLGSRLIPGPTGDLEDWRDFHATLAEFLHEEDVVNLFTHYCVWEPRDRKAFPAKPTIVRSPWCNGSCNMLATALTLWINDHDRVERWMLAKRGRWPKSQGGNQYREYPHTVISYRSDVLGRIYFDALMMTGDPALIARKYGAKYLRRVDKTMLNYMNTNFAFYPKKEHVEKLVTYLNHMLGRWPKAKPFKRPMPWDKLEGLVW